jgi:hypothetical protein
MGATKIRLPLPTRAFYKWTNNTAQEASMKARLLAGTGLAGMMALAGGAHAGGVAPIWHLTGNANFQAYWIDQDAVGLASDGFSLSYFYWSPTTLPSEVNVGAPQEHDWYFGVDEAELQLEVSGSADNGLNYGFKIEINANTTDEAVADEVRLQLYGRWGTLQYGDEDGADNVMNYGGETLLGGAGGFDGDHNDYLFRGGWAVEGYVSSSNAPAFPLLAGDSGDATKISYYTPRIGGFQVGASYTPTFNSGDAFKADTIIEDHYGIGLNFDRSFGNFRARASAVFAAAEVDFAYSLGTELCIFVGYRTGRYRRMVGRRHTWLGAVFDRRRLWRQWRFRAPDQFVGRGTGYQKQLLERRGRA